jgi:hypothetical protein
MTTGNLQTKIRVIGVAAAVFAAFNAVVFAAPFTRGSGFWVAYAFTTLAFAPPVAASLRAIGQATARDAFYRWPVMYVTWVYFILQFASGLIFIAVPSVPAWVAALTGAVLLALCSAVCIAASGAGAGMERLERTVEGKVLFLRSLRGDIEDLAARAEEGELKTALLQLAEEARYSDPMSDGQLAGIEDEIKTGTGLLGKMIAGGLSRDALKACGELRRLLAERNRRCLLRKSSR